MLLEVDIGMSVELQCQANMFLCACVLDCDAIVFVCV